MERFAAKPGDVVRLVSGAHLPEQVHVFSQDEVWAIDAALAARRPLLIRGEPGIGKTQLAKAVAVTTKRAFLPFVVDARTEARDLLWHFDAVARLAEAQLLGALAGPGAADAAKLREALAVQRFVHPRALWWAFDWTSAQDQAAVAGTPSPTLLEGCDPANGAVVLIDEIDKGESDVPNGLLEALGAGEFTPQGRTAPVVVGDRPPLVLITTNEERALPDAFVRRCLVLHMQLPEAEDDLVAHLVPRAQAHFQGADASVVDSAARLLATDRAKARQEQRLPLPGQAEYLDLVRAVLSLEPDSVEEQARLLDQVASFVVRKHPKAAT